jgi:CMP-N-acetylneuraminic acid synthetase/spore coat polysaccharide biosynthesis predicted glycosyltransferase SpsG
MKILGIIPARGGSKGIKRKNLRLLNRNPLIYYQIKNAIVSKFIDDVVVTSDSDEILNYASSLPVYLRKRPESLADDITTLDPVVYDALEYIESTTKKKYDIVITLQATSPLLLPMSLDKAIEKLRDEDLDTILPVTDATHLYWKKENDKIFPDYESRLNRQWLPKKFKEAGAFLITKREFVKKDSRFGENVDIFILEETEGLDIDTEMDFLIAETAIKRLKITFIVNGNNEIGTGHVYRTLTLADGFLGHDITFITMDSSNESISLIKERGYNIISTDKNSLFGLLNDLNPCIIINDILDTKFNYITKLKDLGFFVVNFEDLGDGADEAHLVFNALYEKTNPMPNHRFGYEYECLNEKFILNKPIEFKEIPKILIVTFGGVDQNNMTLKLLNASSEIFNQTSLEKMIVILGGGYKHDLDPSQIDPRIEIHRKVDNMPELMKKADLAVTSNGRTIYELASMGIPTISIAQNDRETLHLFARYNGGIEYLGISCTVTDDNIIESIKDILNGDNLRRKMYNKQIKSSAIIKKGLTKIIDEISSNYWKWKHEKNQN